MPSSTQPTSGPPTSEDPVPLTVIDRIEALGLRLPAMVRPSDLFAPALLWGDTVTTSGQVPVRDGALLARGAVGAEVDLETARDCARQCVLNALAAVDAEVGDLERVGAVPRMTVFVASAPGFHDQPAVADAASALLGSVLGPRGLHARSAVGVIALPRQAPVEIELTAALRPGARGR